MDGISGSAGPAQGQSRPLDAVHWHQQQNLATTPEIKHQNEPDRAAQAATSGQPPRTL
jgi:hypothetical protein